MPVPTLPDLTYREMVTMLHAFGYSLRGEGSPVIVGRNRDGNPFTIHQHPSQKVFKAKLSKILKYAAIDHEAFWAWYHGENR